MNKIESMVKESARRAYAQAEANARYVASVLLQDERGDTNFVSILILLGIALALAAVFFGFRDRILEFFNRSASTFGDAVNSLHDSSYTSF